MPPPPRADGGDGDGDGGHEVGRGLVEGAGCAAEVLDRLEVAFDEIAPSARMRLPGARRANVTLAGLYDTGAPRAV